MQFFAFGHPNIRATHPTTIEFTKEPEVSLRGDCIVGVNADFDANSLKNFIKEHGGKKVKITISAGDLKEEICAQLNCTFDDYKEIVIRKSDFSSKRTFAIKADKAACDLDRRLISKICSLKQKITIISALAI
jgi:hypothetical protein